MSEPVFADKLNTLKETVAAHNRWKHLTDYPSQNTAKMTASRLRTRYGPDGFSFRVVELPHTKRWAVGVMFKQTDTTGRLPQ
jgi:hypothetical protein